eukprot:758219-Hanusia_phi.AAC.6
MSWRREEEGGETKAQGGEGKGRGVEEKDNNYNMHSAVVRSQNAPGDVQMSEQTGGNEEKNFEEIKQTILE